MGPFEPAELPFQEPVEPRVLIEHQLRDGVPSQPQQLFATQAKGLGGQLPFLGEAGVEDAAVVGAEAPAACGDSRKRWMGEWMDWRKKESARANERVVKQKWWVGVVG